MRTHAWRVGEGLGAGEDRCQVLERDRHPEALGAPGATAARERVSASSASSLASAVREVGRVVHDERRAGLGRVGDEPLERAVARRGARAAASRERASISRSPEALRAPLHAAAFAWVARARGSTRTDDGGRRHLDPAEPCGLDPLQQRRRGPPLVRNAETETLDSVSERSITSEITTRALVIP